MSSPNYSAPKSNINIESVRAGSSVKAVIFGALIDIVGSLVLGVVVSGIYAAMLIKQGFTEGQIADALTSIEFFSLYNLIGCSLGSFLSFLGGYVCAVYSVNNVYRDAAILCVISASFGLLIGGEVYTLMQSIFLSFVAISAIFLGAWSWRVKNS